MHLESGIFGGEFLPDGTFSEVFAARVVIPRSEFARLGLGDYERPSRLPACFAWCYANLGLGGTRWSVMLRDGTDALIYFARDQDGVAFLAHWAADAVAEQPVMVVA